MDKKIIKTSILILTIITIIIFILIFVLSNKDKIIGNKGNTENTNPEENPTLTMDNDMFELQEETLLLEIEDIIKQKIEKANAFYAQKIYINTVKYDELSQWYIYGTTFLDNYAIKKKIYIIMDLNEQNMTYNLKIQSTNITLEEFEKDVKSIDVNKINTNIKFDEKNKLQYLTCTKGDLVQRYINYYKDLALYSPEDAYEIIDKEYANIRFGNIDNFKKYINENKEKIKNIKIEKYQYNEFDGTFQYVCLDNDKKYYIINEKSLLNFSILLDEYTTDIPQFIEKYNNSEIQKKVALNINRFISGINDKNYNYSYSILADSFKQNKFPNINIFEKYITENFFEENKLEFISFLQQGSNYVYNVKLKSKNDNISKDLTFVMKLGDETKFEMSFSIDE